MPRAKGALVMMGITAMIVLMLFMRPYTPALNVRMTVAQKGDLIMTERFYGTVGYERQQLCLSPLNGRVSRIYGSAGQQVQKGELLLQLDTAQEEIQLARLLQGAQTQREWLVDREESAVVALQALEFSQTQEELRMRIALSAVRAEMDGRIEALYPLEGDIVSQGSLLGIVHNDRKCVRVEAGEWSGKEGQAAVLRQGQTVLGAAVLDRVELNQAANAPQLLFVPIEEGTLEHIQPGVAVIVEMILEQWNDKALVPITAVTEENKIWVIREGRAQPVSVEVSGRNEHYAALSQEWIGEKLILLPDELDLTEGRKVKWEGT